MIDNQKQSNMALLASLSEEETLSFLQRNGIIDLDDVRTMIMEEERKKILETHPYAISQGKDGRWRTWVKDKDAKGGRKKIAKSSREKVEDAVVEHFLATDEELMTKRMTLRELFPKWMEYKSLHTTAEPYIYRIQSDWKKYYESDPIVDRPIRKLTKLELDKWIHTVIKQHNMTKNAYYNMSMILRQSLNYAVDLGIVETNVFLKVKVDSRRMLRKPKKKKDCTQVYSKEEAAAIFQLAWDDFHNSKRLRYRLAPLAVMFQFLTGIRVGELCAVKPGDIENGYLHIGRMLQRDTKKVVDYTKSHEDRDVILPDAAMELVNVALSYQRDRGLPCEYIFSLTSEPLKYAEVNTLLKKYCKRAEILYRSSHKARKTYVSSLIDFGININTVRTLVGHADERTTYFNYCFDRTPDNAKKQMIEQALAL